MIFQLRVADKKTRFNACELRAVTGVGLAFGHEKYY
jgi:hypothetical protein